MSVHGWHECWRRRRADVGALLVIVVVFTFFFGWVLFSDRVMLGGDAFAYSYPLRTVAWRMIRRGSLPLWTPTVMSGYPLLSMAQLGLGYPLTWGYLFLPGRVAEQIYVFAPFLLAPAFTYCYARELGRTRLAALLAGLSFGYGGLMTNLFGLIGMPSNSLIWLPLMLCAVARVRRGSFVPCLLGATGAYAMALLNGHGQGLLYVGLVALGYGAYLSLTAEATDAGARSGLRRWLEWQRWRPLLIAAGAVTFAAGVGAFQILETMRAARRSIRSTISFFFFTSGAFTPADAFKSLVAPLYLGAGLDVTAYVSPLVCGLALASVVYAWRRQLARDEWRHVNFWLGVAALASLLMLGQHTPLSRIAYQLPLINRFRVPSRHTFEWTFALSILAAYGWDATADRLASRVRARLLARRHAVACACALVLGATASVLWWRATARAQLPVGTDGLWYAGLPVSAYLGWKAVVLAATLLALWCGWRVRHERGRAGLLVAVVALSCLVEPYICVRNWWGVFAKPRARVEQPALLTRNLQTYPPEANRVYTRISLFEDEFSVAPRVDPPDLTARYGTQNVAGYEPLLLERYSRALGDVGLDSVNPQPGHPPNDVLLAPNSHVLDLLNTTVVASYSNLSTTRPKPVPSDQITFDLSEAGIEIKPQATFSLGKPEATADTLALVTSLANSADIQQGSTVARIRLITAEGKQLEYDLRAGIDTADWDHEHPEIRPVIKHAQATVFDRQPGDATNTYQACRYVTRLLLGADVQVKEIELINLTTHSPLGLWAATLFDSTKHQAAPLSHKLSYIQSDPERWQLERLDDDLLILHNHRAFPRAWLVAEAAAVDGEEALHRIRGESASDFDPRRTALLEVSPQELPHLPGGELAPGSTARITTYEPNRLVMETHASTDTVLVVSEMFYPGWTATVDAHATPILLTDYLLRGVALPAGTHKIEMRYAAPAARTGAIISGFTLLLLCGVLVYDRRQARRDGRSGGAKA